MIKEIHDLLKFLVDIALYGPSTLNEISSREGLSLDNTKKISIILIEHQLIDQVDHFYNLNKPAQDYIISELIQEVFHSFTNIKCLKGDHECSQFENCSMNCFWYGIEKVFFEYADGYTLEDLKNGYCFN